MSTCYGYHLAIFQDLGLASEKELFYQEYDSIKECKAAYKVHQRRNGIGIIYHDSTAIAECPYKGIWELCQKKSSISKESSCNKTHPVVE